MSGRDSLHTRLFKLTNLSAFKYRVTKNGFAEPKSRNGPLCTVTTFMTHDHKMTPHDKKERGPTTFFDKFMELTPMICY